MRDAAPQLPQPSPAARMPRFPRPLLPAAAAFLLALGAASPPARAGSNFWTSLGPDGGNVVSLAASPARPGLLYAGCYAGVFRSADGGATWVRASRGLAITYGSYTVAVDPKTPTTAYALVTEPYSTDSLWKSVDAGGTWAPLPTPAGAYVQAIAIDPRSPATLYVGTAYQGAIKSTDGGLTWTSLPIDGVDFDVLAIDPAQPATIYAVARDEPRRIERSTNGGATWTDEDAALPLGNTYNASVQMALDTSTRPSTVYVSLLSEDGVASTFRSRNQGATWHAAGPGGFPLAAAPGVIYAGRSKSTDGGATWRRIALPPGTPQVFLAAPRSATQLYAGTADRGIWRSADGAASWRAASAGLAATYVGAFVIDPTDPSVFYAGAGGAALGRRLLKSANGGLTWDAIGPDWLADYLFILAVDPLAPATVYAGSSAGLARSEDGGATWTSLAPSIPAICGDVLSLALDPAHSGTLYRGSLSFCTRDTTCVATKSTDSGQSWSCLRGLVGEYVTVLLVAPSSPATLYAVIRNNEAPYGIVSKSTDGGDTWTEIDSGLAGAVFTMAVDPTDANRVFVSTQSGVFRTTDGGGTWVEADRKLPIGTPGFPSALAVDPTHPAVVYAGGVDFGVYRTLNGGRTWYPMVGGFPSLFPPDVFGLLATDPRQPGKLYANPAWAGLNTYTTE